MIKEEEEQQQQEINGKKKRKVEVQKCRIKLAKSDVYSKKRKSWIIEKKLENRLSEKLTNSIFQEKAGEKKIVVAREKEDKKELTYPKNIAAASHFNKDQEKISTSKTSESEQNIYWM